MYVIGVVDLFHLIYESVKKHLLSMEKVTMVQMYPFYHDQSHHHLGRNHQECFEPQP